MKVNQKPHTHSKEPKLVPQLPEMLRQQAPRRLKFNNNLSVANQVGSICMFHLPSMELGTNLLLRLKRNPRVDQGDLKCLLVQCLLCIARHRIKHVVYATINPKFVSWAPGRRGFCRVTTPSRPASVRKPVFAWPISRRGAIGSGLPPPRAVPASAICEKRTAGRRTSVSSRPNARQLTSATGRTPRPCRAPAGSARIPHASR